MTYVTDEQLERICLDVRKKKELATLAKSFIIWHANEAFRLQVKLRDVFSSDPEKKAEYKKLISDIRAKARKSFGLFQIPSLVIKRLELLPTIRLSDKQGIQTILTSHVSTKERLSYYPELIAFVDSFKPHSILDIACGMNPLAYFAYSAAPARLVASDISEVDCAALNQFFTNNQLPACAYAIDACKETHKLSTFNSDVCLLLKTLDTLEGLEPYCTYRVIEAIRAKVIIATFTLQNVRRHANTRGEKIAWFEKMLARLECTYTQQVIGAESVYVVKKKSV